MAEVMRIAHRGASGEGLAPENTLAAIQMALEQGVDLVEVDVRVTADGHAVLVHDPTVDRTTTGGGSVGSLTLDQIRKLDAGTWFGEKFRGEKVPTLQEALDLVKRRAILQVETKAEGAVECAVRVIRSMRAQSRVMFVSFQESSLLTANDLGRRIPSALLMTGGDALRRPASVAQRVRTVGANALSVHYKAARPDLIRTFLARALGFWVWTVDDEADMRKMIRMGVGGITTNYPDRLNKVLEDR